MASQMHGSGEHGISDADEMRAMRVRTRKRLTYMGITQIVLAVLAMVAGVVQIVMANPEFVWPFISPLLLISGVLFAISGGFAVMSGKSKDEIDPATKEMHMVTVHYVLCIVCISLSINALVFGALTVASCNKVDIYPCHHNITARTVVGVFVIILGVTIAILSFVFALFYCSYRRAYQMRYNKDSAVHGGDSKAAMELSYSNMAGR